MIKTKIKLVLMIASFLLTFYLGWKYLGGWISFKIVTDGLPVEHQPSWWYRIFIVGTGIFLLVVLFWNFTTPIKQENEE